MKSRTKILIMSIALLLLTSITNSAFAETVTKKNSRVVYTLKDAKGKKYKIYIKAYNEESAKGSYGEYCSWNCVWAGTNEGDTLYRGDYKVYLQSGSKKPTYTKVHLDDYIYNKTRKMIYYLPSKYKGQPDMFGFAETGSSNWESINLYYVKDGKLAKMNKELGYTVRPHLIGKNKMEIAVYNNAIGKWTISTYKLSPNNGTRTKTMDKYYSYDKGYSIIKKWKQSWK